MKLSCLVRWEVSEENETSQTEGWHISSSVIGCRNASSCIEREGQGEQECETLHVSIELCIAACTIFYFFCQFRGGSHLLLLFSAESWYAVAAWNLYLDFLNFFIYLLMLFGERR